jgi:hypothetical protein
MARRKLSIEDQLKGIRAALRSPRTPTQLKSGLIKRRKALEQMLGQTQRKRGSFEGVISY